MRFYILVVCQYDNMDIYVFNNGFMYYTKEPFKTGSTEFGPNITTGYIDRSVYEQNPLTHNDMRTYLDSNRNLSQAESNIKNQGQKISDLYFGRIYELLRDVMIACAPNICNGDKLRQNISFQLFGADIAVNNNLMPQIMEQNKGPNLDAFDDRDAEIKKKCTRDVLKTIGAKTLDNEPNGFIKILDIENGNAKKIY